jgi:hypothetical protein
MRRDEEMERTGTGGSSQVPCKLEADQGTHTISKEHKWNVHVRQQGLGKCLDEGGETGKSRFFQPGFSAWKMDRAHFYLGRQRI